MKTNLVDIFRKNLKHHRIKNKITQEKLSELIGKNANYVGLVENGKTIPPLPVIAELAEILKIKPMHLFDEEGCTENILKSEKNEFAKNLSEKISKNLKKQIYIDICNLL